MGGVGVFANQIILQEVSTNVRRGKIDAKKNRITGVKMGGVFLANDMKKTSLNDIINQFIALATETGISDIIIIMGSGKNVGTILGVNTG